MASNKKDYRKLDLYRKTLNLKTDTFNCPECNCSLLPKLYENHCSQQHNINAKLGCVWCKNFFWPSGTKCDHANHLIECFRKFFTLNRNPTFESRRAPLRLLDTKHSYPENDSFEVDHDLPPHDSIWPPDVESYPKAYPDENLQLACSYQQLYLQTRDTADWLHVMVKSVAYESFVRAMNEDRGGTRCLLFASWCNGGPYEEARHRQHRHLIVFSPIKNHFKEHVWPKVQAAREDKPCPNFPCKRFKAIVSPLHFANTLGYVSHRKSRCNFSFKTATPLKDNHFLLSKSLPKDYLLPLVLLWENGVGQLLYQEAFQNASIDRVLENPLTFIDTQWKQKIKDFYGLQRGLVLPVLKELGPTDDATAPIRFHLMGGETLRFKACPENLNLSHEAWLRKQAEGGNCFYEAVDEHYWIPRPKHQKDLNKMKPLVDRNGQLESANAALKRKCDELEAECRRKCSELESENAALKRRCDESEDECKRLKVEGQEKINRLYEANKKLHEDNKLLHEQETARLLRENDLLKLRIIHLEQKLARLS